MQSREKEALFVTLHVERKSPAVGWPKGSSGRPSPAATVEKEKGDNIRTLVQIRDI